MNVNSKPRRPTSLSLENICYPAFGPEYFKTNYANKNLRQTKSFSSDLHWQCFASESQSRAAASGSEPQPSLLSFIASSSKPTVISASIKDEEDKQTISSLDSEYSTDPETEIEVFTEKLKTFDVSVATSNGKIGPDIIYKRPKPVQIIKVKTPTCIDYSFSKGKKKEISSVDFSFSKNSVTKKATAKDYSFNKSISSKPTCNDYSYGDQASKPTTKKDFSYCKDNKPKTPSRYNYNFAPRITKPTTRYDYKYNWQPTRRPTRYDYKYNWKPPQNPSRYNFSFNRKQPQPSSNLCFCFKKDYDELKSPTEVDHSFDKTSNKKEPTNKCHSLAPVVDEPKKATSIDHSFADPFIPKKSPTFDDTSGNSNKETTTIDTSSNIMIDQGQVAYIKDDLKDTVALMKKCIENVEMNAKEKEIKEKEERKAIRAARSKQIEELILMYGGKNGKAENFDQSQKDKTIKELLIKYGHQKNQKQKGENSNESQLLTDKKFQPRKILVFPRINANNRDHEEDAQLESQNEVTSPILNPEPKPEKKSRRPRPTYLKLNLNYGDSNTAITL